MRPAPCPRQAIREGLHEYWSEAPEPFHAEAVLRDAVEALASRGVHVPDAIASQPHHGPHAVLLAEAVNLAAKVIDEGFYDLKPRVFCAAAMMPGVEHGWSTDGCFYLKAPGAGEVCCHDPYGQTDYLAAQLGLTRTWETPWSGIKRQGLAFAALASSAIRRLLQEATDGRWRDQQVRRIARRWAAVHAT